MCSATSESVRTPCEPTQRTGGERFVPPVRIRAVEASEPLPLETRHGHADGGLSRALPRYLDRSEALIGFVAERNDGPTRPVAVVWCRCGIGRETAEVRWVERPGADDAVMARLFLRIADCVAARGVKWLRWSLRPNEMHLLDSIRIAAGVPVLHREGEIVVAEVAVDPRWSMR